MKDIKEILKKQIEIIKPSEKEYKKISFGTDKLIAEITKKIKSKKILAEPFIGGSLAKGTLIKKDNYDIDIFVRFNKKYENISEILEKLLSKAKKVHGSRDYFQIKKGQMVFEIIPVIEIMKPSEARNVTDLSYFHVNYIKSKIRKNRKLAEEIMIAKAFAYSQNCYGAESYIKGFSGYALELLVSYYGSFLNFIRNIVKREKIIIDSEKFYKNKQIMLELNEAKLQSPIIFVDPTFKERNALAALSSETFDKFKKACMNFLKNPSEKFFEKKDIEKEFKNAIIIETKTNRQKGDIAGSKLKKFYGFLSEILSRNFNIVKRDFEYTGTGKNYFILKKKEKIVVQGPPINNVENLLKFKKKHKNSFIKNGRAFAREKTKNIREIINEIRKDKRMKEMGITEIK